MSPFSPAPCPLRSHRPQLSGREHSAPTLLNQRFSGIWCHSTPPPPSCQGEKSSSLALAARWGGTTRHCLQERRAALQGPGGAQTAASVRPCARPHHRGAGAVRRALPYRPNLSGEKLPPSAPRAHQSGPATGWGGEVFSTKRLSTVGRWDEAAKRKTTLRPPRRIGTAPLPPRLFPRAPTQCGQRAPTKERTGGIFQCAVGFTRGAELSPPFRECSPHRTHSKGGHSCLALQGRPNCVRITLSPYTPTLCDRGAPVKNAPDGTFPAHCRIEICRKRMEPSPPAKYARTVGCTVEGAGPSFQSRPRHVNTAPPPKMCIRASRRSLAPPSRTGA